MENGVDPMQTWSVTNGVIHCTGKPTGYLRTTHTYSNYIVTVEWRFRESRAQGRQHRRARPHAIARQGLADVHPKIRANPAGRAICL